MNCLVTLHTVSDALQLEALLKEASVPGRVIPVPRQLSSSCGYAVQAQALHKEGMEDFLLKNCLAWDTLYEVRNEGMQEGYIALLVNPENA